MSTWSRTFSWPETLPCKVRNKVQCSLKHGIIDKSLCYNSPNLSLTYQSSKQIYYNLSNQLLLTTFRSFPIFIVKNNIRIWRSLFIHKSLNTSLITSLFSTPKIELLSQTQAFDADCKITQFYLHRDKGETQTNMALDCEKRERGYSHNDMTSKG